MNQILSQLAEVVFPHGSRRRTVAVLAVRPKLWIDLVVLGLFRLVRRFSQIQVGLIDSERIGHFALGLTTRFAEESQKGSGRKTIYWVKGHIANSFLFDLMRRNLICHPVAGNISRVATFFRNSKEWFLPPPSRDTEGICSRSSSVPKFFSSEDESAREWLRSVGWTTGQKIVCVLVRDSKFLASEDALTPPDHENTGHRSWNYHDYRDSDIKTFVPAMEWLANQGAFVLRMGKSMAEPLSSQHPKIIDYAFRSDRSDFLDVWLFANCDLCISTGTGPDWISIAYERPVLCVNYAPISGAFTSGPVMTAGKLLIDASGKRLSLQEHFNINFSMAHHYSQAGISVLNLEPEDILEIVREMWRDLFEIPDENPRSNWRRALLIDLLESSPDASRHGWIHPDARLSGAWVEKFKDEEKASKP